MIDVLNKHFQNSLGISKADSALVQGVWYAAYFLMALPSGWVARKSGYRGGILWGLVIVIIGSVLFVPVTKFQASKELVFGAFLAALFVVGSGLCFLETVANPYTTVLGPVESAVSRINLAQSCNAVGWILGPILGGSFILSRTGAVNTSNSSLYLPYLLVAGIVSVMVAIFLFAPVPDLHAKEETTRVSTTAVSQRPLFKEWHFVLAIVSQFLYCAAQTGIFSFFINYIKDDRCMPSLPLWVANLLPEAMKFSASGHWRMTEYGAGILLSVAFGFFTIGRFSGSAILRFSKPHITLGIYALANAVMMLLVFLGLGWVSVGALVLSFFFMSIMYPTHFALAIRGLGERTKLAASFMVTAIVGGSIMPYVMGRIADKYSMSVGFLMPLVCFCFIAVYGFCWKSFFAHDMEPQNADAESSEERQQSGVHS
jgi:FHS family L-fucose permease-like MFS transporter